MTGNVSQVPIQTWRVIDQQGKTKKDLPKQQVGVGGNVNRQQRAGWISRYCALISLANETKISELFGSQKQYGEYCYF